MNGAPTAKPPQFNPKSPLLEEAGSQPPTSRILRESKSTISRPRGWQGQPEVINFLRLPPPICVYFRQRHRIFLLLPFNPQQSVLLGPDWGCHGDHLVDRKVRELAGGEALV